MPSAPLIPLTLVGPGFKGINSQADSTILGAEWASVASNFIFDDTNRLAARKGWTSTTTTAITGSPHIEQLFEYKNLSGGAFIISAANNKLYHGTTSPTDVTGSLTITGNNWQFQNFYGSVYAAQAGHPLIVWNGSGNFVAVSAASGTAPDGNCLLSAFGRLWGTSADGQTVKYSGLLDATNWGATGAGSISLTRVWTDGVDVIQGLAAFNSYLVIFGKRHVIMYEDGSGSELGLDPANIRVYDILSGVGLAARDSVQGLRGDDLAFLSYSGVMSLRRVIEESGNPLADVSKNIRDPLMKDAEQSYSTIKSTYSARNGFYLLVLPAVEKIYCFDTKLPLEDGSFRVTTWDSFVPRSIITRDNNSTIYGGRNGKIYEYSNYLDDANTYRLVYNSGWLALSEEVKNRIKMLKNIAAILFVGGVTAVLFKWGFDFRPLSSVITRTTAQASGGGEWGVGEWDIMEWGGGAVELNEITVPSSGSGQFIKIGMECDVNNASFSIQQLQLFAKVGRVV